MSGRNMSDIIEAYLKSFFAEQSSLEIKRSDIAQQFDCVPSQINYVINTRFTQEHGYQVESKRGGGGYIRIFKIQVVDEIDALNEMLSLVGQRIDQRSALNIIETLIEHEILTEREALLMASVIEPSFLQAMSPQENQVRAVLLKQFLNQLRYTMK